MTYTLTPGLALVRLAHECVQFGGGHIRMVEGRQIIATPDPFWSGTPVEMVAKAETWSCARPGRPWGEQTLDLPENVLPVLDLETDTGRRCVWAAINTTNVALEAQHLHEEDDGEIWDWYWADEVEHEAPDVDAVLASDVEFRLPETSEKLEAAILNALFHHWRLYCEPPEEK